ncbi:hypothetical protein C8Q79DRAFT_265895 [Trametes meyenii]|nr:hypothetical protein C8Q79DRAFT_265895 [Trametes meyenii]
MNPAGGLHVVMDSGAPADRSDYTSLVVIHGYVGHGGEYCSALGVSYRKLIPLANSFKVRVILLNRRDYPGATPYTPQERAVLLSVPEDPPTGNGEILTVRQKLEKFMRDRAKELYESLQALVSERGLPPASDTGGIILAGGSLGSAWMLALLRHVAEFPANTECDLRTYVRRVVLWDPSNLVMGYPVPASQDSYNPLFSSPELTHEARGGAFLHWITSYFTHGETVDTLERRDPDKTPPSTLTYLTEDERAAALYFPPGLPGGSDFVLLHAGAAYGLYDVLRQGALFLPTSERSSLDETLSVGDAWQDVEVRLVWADRSFWEGPYVAHAMRREMAEARKEGKAMRNITLLRFRGANHVAHWDHPEGTLQAFLADLEDCEKPGL